MAKIVTDNKHYQDIAAAIRTQNGEETTYPPSGMAAAILALSASRVTEVTTTVAGSFRATFESGSTISGSVTFDESGLPISLDDDAGNTVEFSNGYPVSVTDSDGNVVSIY